MSQEALCPKDVGLSPKRLNLATSILQDAVASGFVSSIATAVLRQGQPVGRCAFGRRGPASEYPPVENDTIFLLASLSKPVTYTGAMLLVQDGKLSLEQPVASVVPEFAEKGKASVLVRHLFTHTSGLPDQLSGNIQLRTRHAPLADFVELVCDEELLFPPGTSISYQSMGTLMLAEMMERITGERLRDFLESNLFAPLGMDDTSLGMPASGMDRTALALPSGDADYGSEEVDWGWNSPYWRDLGAPWGGLHSTADDMGKLLSHMLGYASGPLTTASRKAMLRDQTTPMPLIPAEQKWAERWGLGWMLGSARFGNLVSRRTFGHTGATGTLFWADPESGLACVLLTNQPDRSQFLFQRYSNALASAIEE